MFSYIAITTKSNKLKQKGLAMQNTKSILNNQIETFETTLCSFTKRFEIARLMYAANIKKIRGISVLHILLAIFELPFIRQSYYERFVVNKSRTFNKDVAYCFLNNCRYNWRAFLGRVSSKVINTFFDSLTCNSRESVLIIDDTTFSRNRSNKVELLAKVFDHAKGVFFKGYRVLQMCWSDGNSTTPVDFAIMSSEKKKNRFEEMNADIDKRCCGFKRRMEAVSKSTDLIEPMVKRAKALGIKARYLLMDSWFGMPKLISKLRHHIDVVCMVKNTPKVFYYVGGQKMKLSEIYKSFRKKRGRALIKGSRIVELNDNGMLYKVKIVFVKNRNKKRSWLAILSTDITLSDAEIVRIYGKRWDIEVYFKMAKQYLNFGKDIQSRSFDAMIAHISIVMLRHIFISVIHRENVDSRTFGGVFRELIAEMKDIEFFEAVARILNEMIEDSSTLCAETNYKLDEIIAFIMSFVIKKYRKALCLA